jgi:hypothetical protein
LISAQLSRESERVPALTWSKAAAWGTALALAFACTPSRVHPPPEGEWLEWEPKPEDGKKKKKAVLEDESKPPPSKASASHGNQKGDVEDLDQGDAKSRAPVVKCNGRDLTRESLCVALSDLGTKACPEKLPNRPEAKEAGAFELPPKGSKHDPSLEQSSSQCCYAWCGRVPAAEPPVPCKSAQPLFCFEAPVSTKHASVPPFAECPSGLEKQGAKGKRKATPKASFSAKRTKEERATLPKACCYDSCN